MYIPGGQQWLPTMVGLAPDQIVKAYESGFVGAYFDSDAHDQRLAEAKAATGFTTIHDAATSNGWAGSTKGQLVIPFVHVLEQYPGCWPGPAQERGDCVSHSDKNACLLTMACDVVSGLPDPKTGKVEWFPEISEEGIRNGCLSSEWVYWFRGSNGDGWSCDASASWRTKIGIMLRQAYPDLGIDLTRYSGSLAGKYGGQKPPEVMQKVGSEHLLWSTANCDTFAECSDALGNGHGLHTCGSEGISNKRDENGVSHRSGSWPHAMHYCGADSRPEVLKLYGLRDDDGLVLDLNSWYIWNSGPRDIYDSAKFVPPHKLEEWKRKGIVNPVTGNIMIPEGSCWIPWSEMRNRQVIAFSGVQGWKPKPRLKFEVDIG
jgi:hypothetical protein